MTNRKFWLKLLSSLLVFSFLIVLFWSVLRFQQLSTKNLTQHTWCKFLVFLRLSEDHTFELDFTIAEDSWARHYEQGTWFREMNSVYLEVEGDGRILILKPDGIWKNRILLHGNIFSGNDSEINSLRTCSGYD